MTNECGAVCKGECLGHSLGDESLTLMRCYNYALSQLYDTLRHMGLSVAKSAT